VATGNGFLVGRRADGHPTEILKANVLFRAVQVGAGIHRVHFAFEPLQGAREKLKEPGIIRMMADTDAPTRW
jgi:hypothetical protein